MQPYERFIGISDQSYQQKTLKADSNKWGSVIDIDFMNRYSKMHIKDQSIQIVSYLIQWHQKKMFSK